MTGRIVQVGTRVERAPWPIASDVAEVAAPDVDPKRGDDPSDLPCLAREEARGAARLGQIVTAAAVFLCLFPNWRHPEVFFTLSDLLFILSGCLLLASRGLPRSPFGSTTAFWIGFFVLFAAALLASSLLQGDPTRAIIMIGQYGFALILLPFVVMGRPERQAVALLKVFVASACATNLFGIAAYHTIGGTYQDFDVFASGFFSGTGRFGAFIGDPNVNAAMIAMAVPCLLYLWVAEHVRGRLALPAFAVLATGLIMTSSVGGLATTLIGTLLFLVLSGSVRALRNAGGAILLGIVVALSWNGLELPSTFETRVLGAMRSGNLEEAGTFSSRMALINEALEVIDETLIVGLGVDQFKERSKFGAAVHNVYLLVLAEGGVFALIGWLGLLLVAFSNAAIARLLPGHQLAGALGLTVTFQFALLGCAAAHMYARHWMIPLQLALAAALSAPAARFALAPRSAPDRHRLPSREVGTLC